MGPVSSIFSDVWLARDVKEPTHCSQTVGHEAPGGVVVCPPFVCTETIKTQQVHSRFIAVRKITCLIKKIKNKKKKERRKTSFWFELSEGSKNREIGILLNVFIYFFDFKKLLQIKYQLIRLYFLS